MPDGAHISIAMLQKGSIKMHKILNRIHAWLDRLLTPPNPSDPIERMSAREQADLPVYHPRTDCDCIA